jgi:hypothetical protein
MRRKVPQNAETAETIALQMLGFLASDEERIGRFMALSGLSPNTLRSRAAEADFLGGVMDYVLADQSLLLAFAESAEIRPEDVAASRRLLPGATE